jgi:hypothetical protein
VSETVAKRTRSPLGLRAKPGLVLSIGRFVDKGASSHPEKLDYFRAKPGPYADKFHAVFGDKPAEVPIAVAGDLPDILDLRWKSYAGGGPSSKSGGYLRALGQSNYVERALDGSYQAVNEPEKLTVWKSNGERGEVEINGPEDDLVAKYQIKLYTTFRFWVPDVLGVGSWAEIATTSEVSTHNLFAVLRDQWRAFRGRWVGLPLILYLQPATARPVVDGKRLTSKYWALAVRTPLSVAEFRAQLEELAPIQSRAALPPVTHDDLDRDHELTPSSWSTGSTVGGERLRELVAELPPAPDEPVRTREEPATREVPDDALLNRIATLRDGIDEAAADTLLVGAFGVDTVEELDAATAARYAEGLERLQPAEGDIVE